MRRGMCLLGALVVGFAVALLSLPVWAADDQTPQDRRVDVKDNEFFPTPLEVPVGTKVVWVDVGTGPHDVTADDRSFESAPNRDCDPVLRNGCLNGQTYAYTFTTPGTHGYYCTVHGGEGGQGMSGTIIVLGEMPTSTSSSTSTTVAGGSTTTRRTTPIAPGPVPPVFTVPTATPPILPPDTIPPNLPGSVTDPTPLEVGPLQAAPGELGDDVVLEEASEDRPWVPATAAFLLLSGAAVAAMITARRTLAEGTPPLPPA